MVIKPEPLLNPPLNELAASDPCLEQSCTGHKASITSVCFNSRRGQLASASDDKTIMVWNFKPHTRAYRYFGHTGEVSCVDFSPSGHLLASCSRDLTIRFWIPSIRGESTVMKAHSATVRSVQFSSDSQLLLSASDDKTLKIWSVARQKFICGFVGHQNWARVAQFSPDSRLIASGSDDKTVKIWDAVGPSRNMPLYTFKIPNAAVLTLRFHPSGNCVAAGTSNGAVRIWDIRTLKLVQHYNAHDGGGGGTVNTSVNGISFHPSGNFLATASSDHTCRIFDLLEGRLIYTLHGHDREVNTVAFSQAGTNFATAGADPHMLLWRTNFDQFNYTDEMSRPRQWPCDDTTTAADERGSCAPRNKTRFATAGLPLFEGSKQRRAQKNCQILDIQPTKDPITVAAERLLHDVNNYSAVGKTLEDWAITGDDDLNEDPMDFVDFDPLNSSDYKHSMSATNKSMQSLHHLMCSNFQKLQAQMEITVQTSMILEQRLSKVEDKVKDALDRQEKITVQLRPSRDWLTTAHAPVAGQEPVQAIVSNE